MSMVFGTMLFSGLIALARWRGEREIEIGRDGGGESS
jgi:hypothetical protein